MLQNYNNKIVYYSITTNYVNRIAYITYTIKYKYESTGNKKTYLHKTIGNVSYRLI